MKKITLIAAFLGFAGVALGSFGAHALRDRLAASGRTAVWETAVFYNLIHSVALLAVAVSTHHSGAATAVARAWRGAAAAWVAGIIGFSGSLYLLALGAPGWLGPITPLGGAALLAGWALAGWATWRR